MSEISAVHTRDQFAAIAELRWRLFVNTLRSTRGKLELLSQIAIGFAFAIGGLGGAFGMGLAAAIMISAGKPELLALLFWFVFFFWQLFPS
jgi:ABC-2 type transport system permease protein